ncbi:MAG TPA: molybdate ABC transporter substrate-binding protein [Anaerolineales bacterium]|nr:molybdate ABC transporter substrate-binding protein [Anaerolineales bacterium]
MKKFWVLTFALLFFFLTACAAPTSVPPTPASQTLTVFAAASLTGAFAELGKGFEVAHPGVNVAFNFGGSQSLRTQLEQGAVADVFASANEEEIQAAVASGLINGEDVQIFATNRLIVILPQDNPARVERLEDLARPGLKLVLAAEEVPVGKYSRDMLDKLENQFGVRFKASVLANVVSSEDNVKQVVVKVQLGEADAGIVYTSDAVAAPELKTISIPAEYNVTAAYPIAVLAASPHSALAKAFVEYVLSAEGQGMMGKWGFGK